MTKQLVLARKIDQKIIVHKDDEILVELKVYKINKNEVRISFKADEQIKIDREEIYVDKKNPSIS